MTHADDGSASALLFRCWRDQAACRDLVTADYDPFFADSAELQAEAIAICETCPVRDACLTFAVRTGQQYGIWGGQPQQIIRRLIALERAGRPQSRQVPAQSSPGQQDPLQARPSLQPRQHLLHPRWPAPLPHLPARGPTHPCPSTPARRRRGCGVTATAIPSTTTSRTPSGWWSAVLLFAACGLVWLIGQVAAILFGAHRAPAGAAGRHARRPAAPARHLGRPRPSLATLLPAAAARPGRHVRRRHPHLLAPRPRSTGCWSGCVSPRARRRRKQRGARWASWWQLRRLLVLGPRRGRIILGRRDRIRDRLLGRLYLAVEQCHSVLAFGPPGSFKTHGLVIPAILEWQGNLVTTSIKPDVLRATCAHRASLGAVWVYDPLGLAGVPGARWTPLAYCRTYADARRIGRMLAEAADVQGHRAEDANYWQLLGAKLLSVLLFAAAGTGRSMADVARWVDVQDVDDVAHALMEIGNQQALDAWAACTSRPDNTMGSVYGTAETLLDVYGDPVIAASAEGCDLDLDELLTGANNTLYLYAPATEQERLRPLFELLVWW